MAEQSVAYACALGPSRRLGTPVGEFQIAKSRIDHLMDTCGLRCDRAFARLLVSERKGRELHAFLTSQSDRALLSVMQPNSKVHVIHARAPRAGALLGLPLAFALARCELPVVVVCHRQASTPMSVVADLLLESDPL